MLSLHEVYTSNMEMFKEPEKVEQQAQPEEAKDDESMQINSQVEKIPFVWIHDVAPGSPAEQDGFKIGDAIYQFGSVTHQDGEQALNRVVDTVK